MLSWLTAILQILGGIGGLGAVGMVIRSLYLLRSEKQMKGADLTAAQQNTALALMAAQSPEVKRLTDRLRDQDEYISELESRLIATRRKLVEVQMSADALAAKYEQMDSQLTAAQMEIKQLRSRLNDA